MLIPIFMLPWNHFRKPGIFAWPSA